MDRSTYHTILTDDTKLTRVSWKKYAVRRYWPLGISAIRMAILLAHHVKIHKIYAAIARKEHFAVPQIQ